MKDHIHKRFSPYPLAKQIEDSVKCSPEVLSHASKAIAGGIVNGQVNKTNGTYGAGVLRFHQFCDDFKVPEDQRMPAGATLVLAFIGKYGIGKESGSTCRSWLSDLRAWHIQHQAPWCGGDPRFTWALVTADREGAHLRRDPNPPVSYSHPIALKESLDLNKPKDAAI